ncbi:MAG: helix-turn-helix domain-containing protein [Prevotella sp.]|nr:helix-turn-helix domain-containing protein [Prevotella sp.]
MIRYIITSLPMLVCLFWSVRLWIDWREQRSMAKWRLLVFSVVTTVLYAGHFAYFNSMEAILPYTETLYSMANLAVFPLYYLYLLEVTEEKWNHHWQVTLLMPSLLIGMMIGGCYAFVNDADRPHLIFIARMVAKFIFVIQVVIVLLKGYQRVKKFDEIVENCYSDIENRTLRTPQIIIIFLVITSIISFLANVIGKEAFVDSLALVSIPCVVFAIILFMLLRAGHMQNFTIHELMEEAAETVVTDNGNNTDIMRETTESVSAEVNAEKIRQISARIEEVMRKEKPFLQPDLRVSDLARLLLTNRDYISRAIRLDKGMSFNEYVNKLRIEHAITLMKNNPQMSVLDLSVKSGYTSQASFFRNFKQFTGTSPKQFKCN